MWFSVVLVVSRLDESEENLETHCWSANLLIPTLLEAIVEDFVSAGTGESGGVCSHHWRGLSASDSGRAGSKIMSAMKIKRLSVLGESIELVD